MGKGGGSACSSVELQLVGVLRRGRCSGVAAAAGRDRTTGGARGRLLIFLIASNTVAMMLHCSRFESESLQVGALHQLDNPCHTVALRAMDQCHDIERLPVN